MMLGNGLVLCLDLFGCADFGSVRSLPPSRASCGLVMYCLVMLWVAGCIALRCTVAPGRVVCHAWFVYWVRHVLSSRVVLQHVCFVDVSGMKLG